MEKPSYGTGSKIVRPISILRGRIILFPPQYAYLKSVVAFGNAVLACADVVTRHIFVFHGNQLAILDFCTRTEIF